MLSADISDSEGGERLMIEFADRYPRLRTLFVAIAYQSEFVELIKDYFDIDVQSVSKEPGQQSLFVLPKRWVPEGPITSAYHKRLLSKDYERVPESTDVFVYLAFIKLLSSTPQIAQVG